MEQPRKMLLRWRIQFVVLGRQHIGSSRVHEHELRSLAWLSLVLDLLVIQITQCLFVILSMAQ